MRLSGTGKPTAFLAAACSVAMIGLGVAIQPAQTPGQILTPLALQNVDLTQPGVVNSTVLGAAANDHLSSDDQAMDALIGSRAIAVGDFNGDGIDDVLIGAPHADPTVDEDTRENAGAAYVIFGRLVAFPATIDADQDAASRPSLTIFGAGVLADETAPDNLGFAVAAGDVNGDGIDDIILGVPGADFPGTEIPAAEARPDTGGVYIIFGSAGLVAGSTIDLGVNQAEAADVVIYGLETGDRFGSSLAVANVGGPPGAPAEQVAVADLIIGAPLNQGPSPGDAPRVNAGAGFVVFGGSVLNPAPGSPLRLIDLAAEETPPAVEIFGQAGDRLGAAAAAADINNGSLADIILGAPGANRPALIGSGIGAADDTGGIFTFFGGTNLNPIAGTKRTFDLASAAEASRPNISIFGIDAGDHAGFSVATGDVTGDGIPDLLIGAPDADGPFQSRLGGGEAYLLSGGEILNPAPGLVERRIDLGVDPRVSLTIFGGAAGDGFGTTVAAGSFNFTGNTDTIPDVLVGAPGATAGRGKVSILFGGPSLLIFPFRDVGLDQDNVGITGQEPGDALGWAIGTGDLNNDSGGDLILGAPLADGAPMREDSGEAYILLASPPSLPPINANPVVTVVSPNGGQTIFGGSTFNITWTASDPDGDATIERFEIRLSIDGGETFNTIIALNVAGAARNFQWNVPFGLNTTGARIRVTVFDNAGGQAQDDSNADFTIQDPGIAVLVTTPNGGESLRFGQTFQIIWEVPEEFEDEIAGFDIFFSNDGGASFPIPIAANPIQPALGPGVRTFNWQVPSVCTENGRVLVVATSGTGARSSDASNGNFTIADFGPTVDTSRMRFDDAITRLILRTAVPPVGSEIRFADPAIAEMSTTDTGTTFVPFSKVRTKAEGTKLVCRGTLNGQGLNQFFPDGATRFVRITNPPCGTTQLMIRRLGNQVVQVTAQATVEWQ